MNKDRPRSFPLNAWYMAAWASEVSDNLLARRLLDLPVVLFRREDGSPVALHDRCPHRFAPLSMGKRLSDGIECLYHGLHFASSGACIANPGGRGQFPPNLGVRSFPLVERHRILWIWPGEADKADPELIPDLSRRMPAPGGFENLGNYLHVKVNWLLETDNIMDLTHVSFLHDGSLGNASMRAGEITVNEKDGKVRAELVLPGTLCGYGPMQGEPCDQWMNVEWMAPATMILDFGAVPPGDPCIQSEDGYAFHIFTPETEGTTHYFFGSSGSYGEEEAWKADFIREAQRTVFAAEDNPMLEAIEQRMEGEEFWSLRPGILPSDAAAIRVRRRVAQMCRMERDGETMERALAEEGCRT